MARKPFPGAAPPFRKGHAPRDMSGKKAAPAKASAKPAAAKKPAVKKTKKG